MKINKRLLVESLAVGAVKGAINTVSTIAQSLVAPVAYPAMSAYIAYKLMDKNGINGKDKLIATAASGAIGLAMVPLAPVMIVLSPATGMLCGAVNTVVHYQVRKDGDVSFTDAVVKGPSVFIKKVA